MSNEVPTIRELLGRIEQEIIPRLEALVFDGHDWNDLIPVTLACALVENSWSILILSQHGMKMQAYTLARSLLETDVELELACESEQNIKSFRLRSEESWLKTFSRAENGNPFFKSIFESENFEESRRIKQEAARKLREDGGQSLKVRERFQRAGANEVYEGLYHKLSDETHGSLSALLSRFVDVSSGHPSFSAFHNPGEVDFLALRQMIVDVLDRLEDRFDGRRPWLSVMPTPPTSVP